MRNKKGFTLVELLAVIVILAVIALIATPSILNVVEKSRKGGAESSDLGYIDAVEKQVMMNELEGANLIKNRTYSVEELNSLGVNVKGQSPDNGNVVIENGEVKDYILGIDKYVVTKTNVVKTKTTEKYDNGYAVYYNPVTGESCKESESVSTTGTKTECMKWYVYNDKEGSSTVNLILDHNTTAKVAWNTVGANGTNVAYEDSNIKPLVDKLVTESKWKSIPRLITAEEVNKITGKTGWTNTSSWYCLESKNQDLQTMPYCNNTGTLGWLYDHTYCKEGEYDWKCPNNDTSTYGYWTSTTYGSPGSGSLVWYVHGYGHLDSINANNTNRGVRPVISVSKSIVS